eukprot:m.24539 g.24539  ORF g.24539 m.24539 type:complete len:69 (-) comp7530_c0_seq1:183-389(-)
MLRLQAPTPTTSPARQPSHTLEPNNPPGPIPLLRFARAHHSAILTFWRDHPTYWEPRWWAGMAAVGLP